jgi:Family of unknown function (DUF6289)
MAPMARKASKGSRQALLFGIVILTLVGIALPTASQAASYCEWTFYSDATYTTIVGERFKTCQGQVVTFGIVTTWKIGSCEPCGGGRFASTAADDTASLFATLATPRDASGHERSQD